MWTSFFFFFSLNHGHSYVTDLIVVFWAVSVNSGQLECVFLFASWLITHKHLNTTVSLKASLLFVTAAHLTDLWSFGRFNSAQVIIRMSQSTETQGTWKWPTGRAVGLGRECWSGGLEETHIGSVFLHPSAPCLRWPECPSVWSLECCRNSSAGKNKKHTPGKCFFHGQNRSDGLG